jgi:hypothetical protein
MISQSGNFILMTLKEGPSGEWFQFDLSDLAAYQLPKCNDWDFGHKHIDSTLNRRRMTEYLPFYNAHGYYPDRKLDKALFSFGQFLKIPRERAGGLQADRGEFKRMISPSRTPHDIVQTVKSVERLQLYSLPKLLFFRYL